MPKKDLMAEKITALIAITEMTDLAKVVYKVLLSADPQLPHILRRTGAYSAAEGLQREGHAFMLNEQGELKTVFELEFTPQTVHALMKLEEKRHLASTMTSGEDLFARLRKDPQAAASVRDLFEAASVNIKQQYIRAAFNGLNRKKSKIILQEMVDVATGTGEAEDQNSTRDFDYFSNRKDRIERGISYLSADLDLKATPENGPHIAIALLEQFIRSLPRGQRFEINPPHLAPQRPKTLEEKLASRLSPEQQAEADAIKDKLFGPGWRTADGAQFG